MKLYWCYTAVDGQGREMTGTYTGSRREVLEEMARRGFEPVCIHVDLSRLQSWVSPKRPNAAQMSMIFEDFGNMHRTGLSTQQMVSASVTNQESRAVWAALNVIKTRIEVGDCLCEAFRAAGVFPWIVMATLHSGEQSGDLSNAFDVLARYFKRQDSVNARLSDALVYPCVVFLVLTVLMFYVGAQVIPKLSQLLPAGSSVKGAAVLVERMANDVQEQWGLFVLAFLVLVIFALFWCRSRQDGWRAFVYGLPFIGRVRKETDMAFYFLNLSVLLGNGKPLLQCINDLFVLEQSMVSRHFYACRECLFGGMPLWESLQCDPFFSSVTVFTVRRGEEMGRLPEYCRNLSEYYDRRVLKHIDTALALVQPLLLAIGGAFLIIIAAAFLFPVYGNLTMIAGG